MLRLSPSEPSLWRSERCLQLGVDGDIRIDDVSPWQERLIEALRAGVPEAMVLPLARSLGARPDEAQRFVARIVDALEPCPAGPLPVDAELPADISVGETAALVQGWAAGGLLADVTAWPHDAPTPARPLLVVADRLADPRRAARLMSLDVTHLPIVLAGDRVTVGPLVVPGRTGCLACLHAHRTDIDPLWPVLASQLVGGRRVETDPGLLLEAAVLAARVLRAPDGLPLLTRADRGGGPEHATASVTLSLAHARRVWRAHRPHPGCLCRSPAGTATADAAAAPFPARTTTATVSERRA